jgi:predicted amidophosphoribosyltransferase
MDVVDPLVFVLGHRCAGCGALRTGLCRPCATELFVDAPVFAGEVFAAVPFHDIARELVIGLKYHGARAGVGLMADVLARRVRHHVDVTPIEFVTHAPTSAARRAERGGDHAALLARAVARRLGRRHAGLLLRTGGVAQTGRSRADRLDSPTFVAVPAASGRNVMVVDDVVTTGATLLAARQALFESGATAVVLVAFAATPGPRAAGGHR